MRWPGLSEIRDMSELQLGSTGLDCNKNQLFYGLVDICWMGEDCRGVKHVHSFMLS